jgi:hypothetical protein
MIIKIKVSLMRKGLIAVFLFHEFSCFFSLSYPELDVVKSLNSLRRAAADFLAAK